MHGFTNGRSKARKRRGGYRDSLKVEDEGLSVLFPFLKRLAHDGRLVLLNKGTMAHHLQRDTGDFILNSDEDEFWTVELKVEQNKTGNLFLETWSNKNLENRHSHLEYGSNPGWMLKLRSDLLFYYFLRADELYVINLFKLQRWAFGSAVAPARIYDFPEVKQRKYAQANDTYGRLVPLPVIDREVGFRQLCPKRMARADQD